MTPTGFTPPAPTAPLCPCRVCGAPMDVQPQITCTGGWTTLVTCWNTGCRMNQYTLDLRDYDQLDLSIYRRTA